MFFSAAPPTPAIIYGKLIQSSLHLPDVFLIFPLQSATSFYPSLFFLCLCVNVCLFSSHFTNCFGTGVIDFGTLQCRVLYILENK